MAYQVFLSYSHTDSSDFALRLAADLEQHGVSIWMDRKIGGGRRWTKEIEDAIRGSTHVLVVLSPGSASSPNVDDEINFAFDEGKQVLPVLYRQCRIPLRLRSVQYVDFTGPSYDQAFNTLLEVFRQTTTLRPSATPDAQPKAFRPGQQGYQSSGGH